jgi:hypothetical protein
MEQQIEHHDDRKRQADQPEQHVADTTILISLSVQMPS